MFSETKQEGDVLRASTFSGMSPICLRSEKASAQNSVFSTGGERLTGFEVLLLNKIAEEMGKSLDLRLNTFAGLVGDIEYKNSDVAAACFSITPERRDKIDFSVVYNVPMNALIVRKDNPDFLEFEAGSKV
ncbi:transporter substrate-binding domain-containing protein [Mulberry dwarf phytoplasma]|uniref:transporter substrate-binding domain-containing protein n=1 Tax=Mulberry dwarf phytoplasma TaxID=186171 RepID=UPI001D108F69|nr:transporter substrate-binding domain-containing protein [Mulberry dwarf phytoplasma]